MFKFFMPLLFLLASSTVNSNGVNVFGVGLYDIKFDNSSVNQTLNFRYEYRPENTLLNIGPKISELLDGIEICLFLGALKILDL